MSDDARVVAVSVDPRLFRDVLGCLPTGVTVITAASEGGPVGMAANSVTSVSLDPPLILFCPGKSSLTWPSIRAAGRFCVNVLAGHHEPLSRQFAKLGVDRFESVAWHARPCGPALEDAVAWIDCTIEAEHDAGDHLIVLGRVQALEASRAEAPLVFFRGGYGTFAEGDLTPR